MESRFDHLKYERGIYKSWEKGGFFIPKKRTRGTLPYSIIMPPPNANDDLHVGHARFLTIQDILVRFYRMRGYSVLWLPGADHAGIETQYVFEKKLSVEGKSRFDYSRDELFESLMKYTLNYKGIMENQIRAIGCSCDWTKSKFTLDKDIINIVYKTFKKLYDDGLVYRGETTVNYCTKCGTAFSQLEVNHSEEEGVLYTIDYGSIKISTTRPETIFADSAVCVNPKDERYKKYVGREALIPIVNRKIPIIADRDVDMEFGTGALKVTPAHDFTDFEIGKRHKLSYISVIGIDGRMINVPTKYVGKKVLSAREMIINDLKKEGKIVSEKKILHVVGRCYRCNSLIEPTVLKQWFIKADKLSALALSAINQKQTKFDVKKYEKTAKHWLKNLKDWNVSRQIVWGIQIPAWRCNKCMEWIITDGEAPSSCPKCGHTELKRDPDTFDTWFSSGQWPFATLLSLDKSNKNDFSYFDYYYPTSVMETAYDIIPFWVIRMIMLGIYATGNVPFKRVLIHGLVRDGQGQKISKSKGNVINPLVMIEKYGADALRSGLIWGALVENDISLSEEKIRAQRNFANKIWNIARYINQGASGVKIRSRAPKSNLEADAKIIKELKNTARSITRLIEKHRLNEAIEELYNFIWKSFASEYLESTKTRREESQKILEFVLQESLKLVHPFMPFVSEAIWGEVFGDKKKGLLIEQRWPVNL